MAKLKLSDGRIVPIVKPHIGDQMELERQMRATDKKYGAANFKEDLDLSGFQTAFVVWASLKRAGVQTSIHDVLELDLNELAEIVEKESGDDVEDDDDTESEGEQTGDPQLAQTGDAAPEPSQLLRSID
jgi:hypothetical protein